MLLEHAQDKGLGREWRQNLHKEVVGLRGNDTQEGNCTQFGLEVVSFLDELVASTFVVFLVLGVYLHEELAEGVEVPDAYHLLYLRDDFHVGRAEDAQAYARHTITLADGLHYQHVRITFQYFVGQEAVLLPSLAEIHETLVHNEPYSTLLAPVGQHADVLHGDEVAGGIVGVDEQDIVGRILAEEVHEILCRIAELVVLGNEGDERVCLATVRIFLERGAGDAQRAGQNFHQCLNQFGGTIARNYIVLLHTPALACQQGVHLHARRVFGNERAEVGLHLVYYLGGTEIRVHQIAEVKHLGEAPVTAETAVVLAHDILFLGKESLGNVQVLLVVYLVPLLVGNGQGLQVLAVQEGDDAQDILVVLVVAHGLGVGLQEGDILRLAELSGKLVYVDGLVVLVHLLVSKGSLGDEVHDVVLVVYAYHGAVHPCLVLCHEGKVGIRILQDKGEEFVVEDEVALYEQGIILLHLLLGQGKGVDVVGLVVYGVVDILYGHAVVTVAEVVHQFLSFITHHDDHAVEVQCGQLPKHTIYESGAVHLHHTLGILFCKLAQALAHSGG